MLLRSIVAYFLEQILEALNVLLSLEALVEDLQHAGTTHGL